MKKILFISSIEAVHISRWYDYFNRLTDFETKLVICKHYMGTTFCSKIRFLLTIKERIINVINSYNPDIINLHTLLFPNYLLPKHIECKIVVTPWNGDIVWYKYGKDLLFIRNLGKLAKVIRETQVKRALNSSTLITYNSPVMKRRVEELSDNSIPREYIQVPGVDTVKWVKAENMAAVRRELNLPEDKFIILSPRQLGPIYNIDVILDAARMLRKMDDNILFVFAFHMDKNKLRQLVNKISRHGLEEIVRIVGQVEHDRMLKYYQACNIGVSISSKDSCPQSVLEGMSAQLPMIVSDIPELRELFTGEVICLFTPCRAPELLAKNILTLLSDRDLMENLAKNAHNAVLTKFDYSQNMRKMHKLFMEL